MARAVVGYSLQSPEIRLFLEQFLQQAGKGHLAFTMDQHVGLGIA